MKPYLTIYTKEHGKIKLNTYEEWWVFDTANFTLHREDGPAVEFANGHKEYWLNGKLHREDGPAIEWTNGTKFYWLNDKLITEKEFNEKKRKSKKLFLTIYTKEQGKIEFATSDAWCAFDHSNITYHREDGPAVEWTNGTKFYYRNGELHREDGPAREFANGTKEYWLNGQLHRADGPAVEWINGTKFYWLNGELHREGGPAIECATGHEEYWLNGKLITEE